MPAIGNIIRQVDFPCFPDTKISAFASRIAAFERKWTFVIITFDCRGPISNVRHTEDQGFVHQATRGGELNAENGKAECFTISVAEKTYADFQLEVTNPGGHSSAPRKVNAINEVSAALVRIGDYRFTPQLSPITKGFAISCDLW